MVLISRLIIFTQVTATGEPIIPYSGEGSKQPFERLMFGCEAGRPHKIPEDFKCIISVPSSIHSHKPPINGKFL